MSEVNYLEFPIDDVQKRVEFVRCLLPVLRQQLSEYRSRLNISSSESSFEDRTLMTEADNVAEKVMLEALLGEFPKDGITSEVAGRSGEDGEFEWWIDPVDGTRNFIHGVPLYCCSIGLTFRETPVAGLVYLPEFKSTYSAISGMGAEKNGNPIRVSEIQTLERALISSGLPFRRQQALDSILANFSAFVVSGAGLRRTGSFVLDLCWIAEGLYDATWLREVSFLDTCAVSVILKEAGGRITDFSGKEPGRGVTEILASNGVLHEPLLETLQNASRGGGIN